MGTRAAWALTLVATTSSSSLSPPCRTTLRRIPQLVRSSSDERRVDTNPATTISDPRREGWHNIFPSSTSTSASTYGRRNLGPKLVGQKRTHKKNTTISARRGTPQAIGKLKRYNVFPFYPSYPGPPIPLPKRTEQGESSGVVSTLALKALGAVSAYMAVGVLALVQAEGWSPIDAGYFLIVTLTTVGYGNIEPGTAIGKLVTVGFIFLGVSLVATLVAATLERVLSTHQNSMMHNFRDAFDMIQLDKAPERFKAMLVDQSRQERRAGVRRIVSILGVMYLTSILWCKFSGNLSIVDSIYFSTITMTTVGYGERLYNMDWSQGLKIASIFIVGGSVFMFGAVLRVAFELWSYLFHRRCLLESLGVQIGSKEFEQFIEEADVDGNNKIDMAEYLYLRLKHLDLLKPDADLSVLVALKREFEEADKNGDGQLSLQDFTEYNCVESQPRQLCNS